MKTAPTESPRIERSSKARAPVETKGGVDSRWARRLDRRRPWLRVETAIGPAKRRIIAAPSKRPATTSERFSYATAAGDSAARVYANTEAVSHYATAIEAAQRLGIDDGQLGQLFTRRRIALELGAR